MKTRFICMVAAFLMLSPFLPAQGRTLHEMRQIVENPRLVQRTDSPRMHVVFPHAPHKQYGCRTCHHEMTPERKVYVSCSQNAACHNQMDVADRSSRSYFQAMHDVSSGHSCLGCHTQKAAERPGLAGCNHCHQVSLNAAK